MHDTVVCAYRNSGISDARDYWDPPIHAEMICDLRFKLTLYHDTSGRGSADEGQLFDLRNDPDETKNLWGDPSHAPVCAPASALSSANGTGAGRNFRRW